MQNHLQTLRSCKDRMTRLREELSRLATPRLADFSLLPALHAAYLTALPLPPTATRPEQTLHRRVFVALALYACDPLALTGEKMRSGLRAALSKTLNATPNTLSCDMHDLPFLLDHDHHFIAAVNRAHALIFTPNEAA